MRISNSERKLNNKGFSLLELIVTIAVMTLLVTIAVLSVAMLDSSYVKDTERGVKDYISMTRTKSMSVAAKDWYMTVSKDGSDYYAHVYKVVEVKVEENGVVTTKDETTEFSKQKLGKKVDVFFGQTTSSFTKITDTKQLQIHFDPSTGKVKQLTVGGVVQDLSSGIGYLRLVRNDYDINLKLFYNTGKCERE